MILTLFTMPSSSVTHFQAPHLVRPLLFRGSAIFLVFLVIYTLIFALFIILKPNDLDPRKAFEDSRWIATSESWLDRIACRRLGVCGGPNWLLSTWIFRPRARPQGDTGGHEHCQDWLDKSGEWRNQTDGEIRARTTPDYVFGHAPLL